MGKKDNYSGEPNAAELEIMRGNAINDNGQPNVKGADDHYQDFDNVGNPT